MKIALAGYGSMGREIASLAAGEGVEIAAVIDPAAKEADFSELQVRALQGVEAAVDFTAPGAVLENIKRYCDSKVNAVIGTTGWYESLPEVEKWVKESGISLIWGSNFSLEVNLYFNLIAEACRLFSRSENFDVWGRELHHRFKKDSPSGTAKTLSEIIIKNFPAKRRPVYGILNRAIAADELHFSSTRGGAANFEHTVGFEGPSDTITVTHRARGRKGYALGALRAAKWLKDQEPGFYSVDDFISNLLHA